MILTETVCFVVLMYISCALGQTVNTTNGKVKGIRETILGKDVEIFYGIPFAKPPVETLRFKRPVPVDSWEPEVYNATTPKASCYQSIIRHPNPLENIPRKLSEDCLYLNIFVPVSTSKFLPVILWIFGGGFISGSAISPMFNGKIISTVNDVIVVTTNYRLGALGFLRLDAETVPGNMGLLDQTLALKWVHGNIANFGGDPTRISLAGQSAGAGCVSLHLLSPLSQPFFNNAIIQSGSPLTNWDLLSPEEASGYALVIAKKAKCKSMKTNEEIYECLNKIGPSKLLEFQSHLAPGANVAFAPVVDGHFLTDRPLALLKADRMKNCSVLLGVNRNEGALFLMYGNPTVFPFKNNISISNDQFMADLTAQAQTQGGSSETVNALYQEYVLSHVPSQRDYVSIADELLGDFSFKCPSTRFAGLYAPLSPVYFYAFNHRLSSCRMPNWMGVKHGGELPFTWGHALDPNSPLTFTPAEKILSRNMMAYWTNFAKYDTPNGANSQLATWPQYDRTDERYLEFAQGGVVTTGEALRRRHCVFLYQTVPLVAALENESKQSSTTQSRCDVIGGAPAQHLDRQLFISLFGFIILTALR